MEFRLAEFDDGAQAEIVTGLRKVKRKARLFAQFLRHRKPLIGKIGVLPSYSDIASDVIPQIGEFLTIHLGFEIRERYKENR